MSHPDTAQSSRQASAPVALGRILVALDASDHANRALAEALRLVDPDGVITGIHAYAAKLHDRRFRQMEGGLPERYRKEEEMDYQRDVHDDLITRGLSIISDSYHDAADVACAEAKRAYGRLSPEGKNYRRIAEAVQCGAFDLVALGAVGLGVIAGATIGTVCERVVRRSPIDALVIRNPNLAIGSGPIVVGIDGSPKSFGVLMTAFVLAERTGAELHAVAAFDPHYHYVAFGKIAKGLSKEQGEVFRFQEQEQLHEELIDEGIAKIYLSHLKVAADLAAKQAHPLVTKLLEGKPHHAIRSYLAEVGASLVMVGMTGIHADDRLDIGGCSENLLRWSPCHIWLGQAEFEPDAEVVAAETIMWSEEAEARLTRAPEFVRAMARKAVIRHAQELGHTFITSDMVDEVSARLMPGRGGADQPSNPVVAPPLDGQAAAMVSALDPATASNVQRRAEKAAIRDGSPLVTAEHVKRFLDPREKAAEPGEMAWSAAALARLAQVPEAVRDHVKSRVESLVRAKGGSEVTPDLAEEAFAEARKAMHAAMSGGGHQK